MQGRTEEAEGWATTSGVAGCADEASAEVRLLLHLLSTDHWCRESSESRFGFHALKFSSRCSMQPSEPQAMRRMSMICAPSAVIQRRMYFLALHRANWHRHSHRASPRSFCILQKCFREATDEHTQWTQMTTGTYSTTPGPSPCLPAACWHRPACTAETASFDFPV